MNLLFISLVDFESINERHIYTDLLREFRKHGHSIYAISPVEKRKGKKTYVISEDGIRILKLRIGNTQKTNVIEKGISIVSLEPLMILAIKKYFSDVRFDLVLYPTPPITFYKAVEYVKRRDGARSYLLLKDIFPQNAVDISMMREKGILHRYFRAKEKRLYRISDRIGCMSPANVKYLLKHNSDVRADKVEICPNSVEPVDMSIDKSERERIRLKYGIPIDRTVFIYGGNLGKPQGIGFMLKCLHSQRKNRNVFFLIIGNGTEYSRIERYLEKYQPENIRLHQWLSKEDYDKVVAACDVGLIFLDHRFTIPNFPSRLLNYMQCKLPVFAVTDRSTDIGDIITENGFGWWCGSDDLKCFTSTVEQIYKTEMDKYRNGFNFLNDYFSVKHGYKIIIDSIKEA